MEGLSGRLGSTAAGGPAEPPRLRPDKTAEWMAVLGKLSSQEEVAKDGSRNGVFNRSLHYMGSLRRILGPWTNLLLTGLLAGCFVCLF